MTADVISARDRRAPQSCDPCAANRRRAFGCQRLPTETVDTADTHEYTENSGTAPMPHPVERHSGARSQVRSSSSSSAPHIGRQRVAAKCDGTQSGRVAHHAQSRKPIGAVEEEIAECGSPWISVRGPASQASSTAPVAYVELADGANTGRRRRSVERPPRSVRRRGSTARCPPSAPNPARRDPARGRRRRRRLPEPSVARRDRRSSNGRGRDRDASDAGTCTRSHEILHDGDVAAVASTAAARIAGDPHRQLGRQSRYRRSLAPMPAGANERRWRRRTAPTSRTPSTAPARVPTSEPRAGRRPLWASSTSTALRTTGRTGRAGRQGWGEIGDLDGERHRASSSLPDRVETTVGKPPGGVRCACHVDRSP